MRTFNDLRHDYLLMSDDYLINDQNIFQTDRELTLEKAKLEHAIAFSSEFKNDAQRKASLTLSLSESPEIQMLQNQLQTFKANKFRIETELYILRREFDFEIGQAKTLELPLETNG